MENDKQFEECVPPELLQQVVDACRVTGRPVPHIFAAYCLITLTLEDDDGPKEFVVGDNSSGPAAHNTKQQLPSEDVVKEQLSGPVGCNCKPQLPPEFAPAVRRATGDTTPSERPLVACLRLQALYEAAVIRETENYEKASGKGTAPAVTDKVLSTPFTAVRNEKLLLELYRKLSRFCYSQFRRESWASFCGDEALVWRTFQAIFEMVLPIKAVRSFVRLTQAGRLKYLQELYHIVLGSCIVHTQAGTNVHFPDPRKLLSKDISAAIEKLSAWIAQNKHRSQALCDFLLQRKRGVPQADVCQDDAVLISREHLFLLQAFDYCKGLKDAMQQCFKLMRAAVVLCFTEILNARKTCDETAFSKEVAFPILEKVALRYRQAFKQRHRLDALFRLADTLTSLLGSDTPCDLVDQVTAKYSLKASPAVLSNQRTNNDICLPADDDELLGTGSVCSSMTLKDTHPRNQEVSYGLNAYCPWTLMNYGALVPGDKVNGVLTVEGCNYVFSSTRAREECEKEGPAFLQGVREQLLKTPPLIHFLKADHFFPQASLRRLLSETRMSNPEWSSGPSTESSATAYQRHTSSASAASSSLLLKETCLIDKAVMTPTHFDTIDRDNSYCWDEWKLRRQALQMASIKDRRTKHSQTHLSRCRTDQETQVYLPREKGQNTMKTTGTSTIRKNKYITNLRGRLNTEAFSASLEVDL